MIQFILIFLGLLSPNEKPNRINIQETISIQNNLGESSGLGNNDGNGPGHGNGGSTGGNTGQNPPPFSQL